MIEQMSGKTVTQKVGVNLPLQPSGPRTLQNDLLYPHRAQGPAPNREKYFTAAVASHQLGAP